MPSGYKARNPYSNTTTSNQTPTPTGVNVDFVDLDDIFQLIPSGTTPSPYSPVTGYKVNGVDLGSRYVLSDGNSLFESNYNYSTGYTYKNSNTDLSKIFVGKNTKNTTPAHTTPAHTTPAHTTHAHTTPAHTTPAHTTPAHTTPANTTPVKTTEPLTNCGYLTKNGNEFIDLDHIFKKIPSGTTPAPDTTPVTGYKFKIGDNFIDLGSRYELDNGTDNSLFYKKDGFSTGYKYNNNDLSTIFVGNPGFIPEQTSGPSPTITAYNSSPSPTITAYN